MPFWACTLLHRPLRDATVSLLEKKSEEGQIPYEAIFQQPAREESLHPPQDMPAGDDGAVAQTHDC